MKIGMKAVRKLLKEKYDKIVTTPDIHASIYVENSELNMQLRRQKEQLEELLNRERQYRLAIMEGAAAIYEINLTKDLLLRASGYHKGREYALTEKVQMEIPCKYSEYVSKIADMLTPEQREEYLQASNREHLLDCFHNKELHTDDVYLTKDLEGHRQYLRKSYILTQNRNTGDVFALIIAKNVTEQMKKEMVQREIIEGMSLEFTSIYLIDWKKDTIRLFKTQNVYPSIMQPLSPSSDSQSVIRKYVETAVHPEDREYVLRESESENLRRALCEKRVVDINYRRIVDGKMDHAQMHCVRVDDSMGGSNIVMAFRSREDIVRKEQEHNAEKARLKEKARTDGLTGMLNKEAFRKVVETHLSQNTSRNAAFLFVDLDHFKQVNDTLGHSVGDVAIHEMAEKMRSVFAHCDYFGRFGGDEFCLFMENISMEMLNEELSRAIEEVQGSYSSKEQSVHITTSIGCVYCMRSQAEYMSLQELADAALYDAKEQGRHRYVMKVYK